MTVHEAAGSTMEHTGSWLESWERETWWSEGTGRCTRRQGRARQRGEHSPQGGTQAGTGGEEAALDWASLGTHILVMSCQDSALVQPDGVPLGVSLGQGFPGWPHTFFQLAQLLPDCADSFLQRLVQGLWCVPNVQVRQCALPLVPINLSQTP